MNRKYSAGMLALATFLGGSSAAHAQGTVASNASLSNLQIHLEDMNADDGVSSGYTVTHVFGMAQEYGPGYWQTDYAVPASPYAAEVRQDTGNAASVDSATGSLHGASLSALATSDPGPNSARHAQAEMVATLTLTPGTRITVTADGFAGTTGASDAPPGYGSVLQLGISQARPGSGSIGGPLESISPPAAGDSSRQMTVSWDNPYNEACEIQVFGYARVGAVAAVPEAAPGALMLGGLAVVGTAGMRRRRAGVAACGRSSWPQNSIS